MEASWNHVPSFGTNARYRQIGGEEEDIEQKRKITLCLILFFPIYFGRGGEGKKTADKVIPEMRCFLHRNIYTYIYQPTAKKNILYYIGSHS